MADLPVLDETLCNGCGDCVATCPTLCLEMIGLLPWLSRPEDCVRCNICVTICPVAALQLAVEATG
jgi:2-oxoglutarate ferredoxin oxidoreductase subunit delta